MFLEGVSERGSPVAVRTEAISAVRKKGDFSWVCVYGQWLCVDTPFEELVPLLSEEDKAA